MPCMRFPVLLALLLIPPALIAQIPQPAPPSRPLRQIPQVAAEQGGPRGREMASSAGAEADAEATEAAAIPGIDRELTRDYIRRYSAPSGLAYLAEAMNRGGPYLAFIRDEIEKRGLPPELLYLPVIESGYLASATSRAGAAGLWQFMRNSAAPFDLQINDWVDERMDFWKSTIAALQKLEENYAYFQDWPLALAAYNAGSGTVRRAIRETGIQDYWTLAERKKLKTETIHYVPKLLAAAHILSRQRQYGLPPVWPETVRWTRIKPGVPVDLEVLAELAGLDAGTLRLANRELRFAVTPADGGYYLKIPEEHAAPVTAALERTDVPFIRYHYYIIRSGDTLSALGQQYGVSAGQIASANPGLRERFLKIGEQIRIPRISGAGGSAVPAVPANSGPLPGGFTGSHVVQRGETLWSIARLYGASPETLAAANGMAVNDVLREGRVLKTPILGERP